MGDNYILHNALTFAFRALRQSERHVKDSIISPYQEFFDGLAVALSPEKKLDYLIPNSEVEAFYIKRTTEKEFITHVHSRILSKIPMSGPGTVIAGGTNVGACSVGGSATVINSFNQYSLLYTIVWDLLTKQHAAICNKLPKLSGKQLWEIFLKLDTGQLFFIIQR